jgi:hypothetical protein
MKKALALAILLLCLSMPASPQGDIAFTEVSAATIRLTNRWTFVIDTSSSLKNVFFRVNTAFMEATKYPEDELKFKVITFNNEHNVEVLTVEVVPGVFRTTWQDASPQAFLGAAKWIAAHGGVRSFGAKAIKLAYEQSTPNLTIILITDGGFSEGFDEIRAAIRQGKEWRSSRGLSEPVLVTIGIENPNYSAGNKPSDEVCQAFLKEIGEQCGGGYYLVSGSLH